MNTNEVDFSRDEEAKESTQSTEIVKDEIVIPKITTDIPYADKPPLEGIDDVRFIMPSKVLREKFNCNSKILKGLATFDYISQAMFLVFRETFRLQEIQKLGSSIVKVDPTINKSENMKDILFMDINPDELEDYMKFSEDGEDNPEVKRKVKEMERLIRNYTQFYYIRNRENLFSYHPELLKGFEPEMLNLTEVQILEVLLGKFFSSGTEVGNSLSNASSMTGLDYTFKELSLTTRKRYELLKIGLINEQGFTEESVNKYIEACIEYSKRALAEGKYSHREEAKYDLDGVHEAQKLLVKDEEWVKHFEETGEKLQKYSTKMFEKIVEHDTKGLEDYIKQEGQAVLNTPQAELIKAMDRAKSETFKNGFDLMMASEGKLISKENNFITSNVDRSDEKVTFAEKRKQKREQALLGNKEIKSEPIKKIEDKVETAPKVDKFANFNENLNKNKEERKEKEVESNKVEPKVIVPDDFTAKADTVAVKEIETKPPVTTTVTKEPMENSAPVNLNPYTFNSTNSADIEKTKTEIELLELEMRKIELQEKILKARQSVVTVVEEPKEEVKTETGVKISGEMFDPNITHSIVDKVTSETKVAKKEEPPVYEPVEELNKEEILKAIDKVEEDTRTIEEINKQLLEATHIELEKQGINPYDEFPQIKTEPDPTILRTVSNPLQRIRAYEASAKDGRNLFLINSGYNVFIKKIRDRNQLTYLLNILEPNEDNSSAIDQMITDMCIDILYSNIEFPFETPVSRTDFLKCLSPNDIVYAMLMFAIVNLPINKEGKCSVKINSLICTNEYHGDTRQIYNLKAPITIDALEEFRKLYKLDAEALDRMSKFKNADYKTIYEAYEQNGAGINEYAQIKDEFVTYNVILSPINLYKINKQKDESQKIMYDTVRKDILEDSSQRNIIETKFGKDFETVERYIDNTTYDTFKQEATRLSGLSLRDLEYNFAEIEDETERNKALTEQELDKTKLIAISHIIPLLTEYMERLDYALVILNFIESLEVKSNSTDERIAGPLSHDTYDELLQVFTEIPNIKEIGDAIDRLTDKINTNYDDMYVKFNTKDIKKFLPPFNEVFASEDKFIENLKNSIEDPKQIEAHIQTYHKHKENMEHGNCFCGSSELILDWRSILFQCLSKAFHLIVK